MKLLLDECVTHSLGHHLAGHEVHTVKDAGLKGLENGELLKAAAGTGHHDAPVAARSFQASYASGVRGAFARYAQRVKVDRGT